MKHNLKKNPIIIVECSIFMLVLLIIWMDEFVDIPHHVFHASPAPYRIEEYLFETFSIVLLAIFVIITTYYFEKRIHQLESFLRVCAWCRKVFVNDKWIDLEEYLSTEYQTKSTHGICPDCKNQVLENNLLL